MEEFIQLVATMRKAQKAYFRSRDPFSLQEAKKQEQLVDFELEHLAGTKEPVKQPETDHPKLF